MSVTLLEAGLGICRQAEMGYSGSLSERGEGDPNTEHTHKGTAAPGRGTLKGDAPHSAAPGMLTAPEAGPGPETPDFGLQPQIWDIHTHIAFALSHSVCAAS